MRTTSFWRRFHASDIILATFSCMRRHFGNLFTHPPSFCGDLVMHPTSFWRLFRTPAIMWRTCRFAGLRCRPMGRHCRPDGRCGRPASRHCRPAGRQHWSGYSHAFSRIRLHFDDLFPASAFILKTVSRIRLHLTTFSCIRLNFGDFVTHPPSF